MADAIISSVVERVADIIEDQIRYQVNLVRGVEKKVLDLSDKLKTIRNVLDDAEKRGAKEQSVKNWLSKLQRAAYEMDDVLDEWNYALLKHNMERRRRSEPKVCSSFVSSSCLSFNKVVVHRRTAKKIQNLKDTLDQILKEKDEFSFVMSLPAIDSVPIPPRVQSISSVESEKVHGLDIYRNKNDIVRKLINLNGDSQIMGIVGMGGIGKTTLAQLVYNDARVKDCFDLRIWICVSDPFDVGVIARGIVDVVGKERIPSNTNQLDLVLQKLRDSILGKKFLLVLDDVWTEDYNKWEPLKINLGYGALGSKILVTTRNERVAKMMMRGNADGEIYRPKKLTDEECWKLLRRISLSGKSKEECAEFEDVGKKISRKCDGLPLAANVLGSLLQFKNSVEEWENILESEIWRLEEAKVDIFPHLLLSYNELSPALKRCFSYCGVYPKDCQIQVERLIEEWMAQGYLGYNIGYVGLELKGLEYFNNLTMRSLFQHSNRRFWPSPDMVSCTMHDIVHDFAQFLRKGNEREEAPKLEMKTCDACDPILVSQVQVYRRLFYDNVAPRNICDCHASVRVLGFKRGLLNGPPLGMEKLIHLRWLDLTGTKLSNEDIKIICRLYLLQTLYLASCSIKEIPGEIGNLVHLRHLNLHSNEELKKLPESICSLVELQILNIEGCGIMPLPEGISKLENLQHLLSGAFLGHLSYLFTLRWSLFRGGNGCNKLGLLKNLNRLTRALSLRIHFSSATDLKELAEDAREAKLRNKIHIHMLHMIFIDDDYEKKQSSSSASASALWIDVIEALEPSQKLKDLKVVGYKGSKLPHWFSSPLNLIKLIYLFDLSELSSLPSMGKLPFLEVLVMEKLKELKLVGREFLGIECSSSSSRSEDVVVFPKLEKLILDECPNWSEWEDITEEEVHAAVSIMPRLTELRVISCGGLAKLPLRLLRKARSLEMLYILRSQQLIARYAHDPRWKSKFQNPKLSLLF